MLQLDYILCQKRTANHNLAIVYTSPQVAMCLWFKMIKWIRLQPQGISLQYLLLQQVLSLWKSVAHPLARISNHCQLLPIETKVICWVMGLHQVETSENDSVAPNRCKGQKILLRHMLRHWQLHLAAPSKVSFPNMPDTLGTPPV